MLHKIENAHPTVKYISILNRDRCIHCFVYYSLKIALFFSLISTRPLINSWGITILPSTTTIFLSISISISIFLTTRYIQLDRRNRILVSSGAGLHRTIRVWDVNTCQPIHDIQMAHNNGVACFKLDNDKVLLSSSFREVLYNLLLLSSLY